MPNTLQHLADLNISELTDRDVSEILQFEYSLTESHERYRILTKEARKDKRRARVVEVSRPRNLV